MNEAITQLDKLARMVRRADFGFVPETEWIKTLEESEALVRKYIPQVPVSGKAGIDVVT